ncbi:MAG: ATP-binding protein, partial [Geminicoccaceae bacterium]
DAVLGQPCHASSHRCDTPCAPTMVTCPLHELGNGRNSLVCRHRHVRSDGHELFVEISAAILEVDDNGEPLSVVESIRNLSQDVALGHEQKLSELGMLAAGIAHEIRNPLSSIRIGLQALQGGSPSVDASSYLDLMQEEIDKCIEVTDRLLKLSVPTRGHDALVDLAVLVPDVMTLLASDAEQRGIAVDIDLPLSLRVIGSDSDLRMLVLNLAQNAFHAMVDGGRLKVTGKCDAGTVLIAMEDTGCGISPEHLERIFQPFWSRRADRGGTAGTGLGLSICREIVKAHGGRIEVESRLGEGTTFTVHIPWADGP